MCSSWRILPHLAPQPQLIHIHYNNYNKLGFRGIKNFRICSANMESVKSVDKRMTENNRGSADVSALPENDKPHSSEKLLTLPTILTIARVAAVPVLISSTFNLSI